jgi:hypothetical protein
MEWMDNLSDDLKENKSLQDFKDLNGLAKSYVDTKAMMGNSIRMAGPDASDEDRAKIYQKVMTHMPELVLKPNPDSAEQSAEYYAMLGVPADAGGYNTDDIKLSDEILNELKTLAHGVNMSKSQFKVYANKMAEMQGSTIQNQEDARVRMGAELKTEWGMAFEDRYAVVEKHLAENPGLGVIEDMTPAQIKSHYEVSRSLNGVKQMRQQPVPETHMSPSEAQAQMAEIDSNPLRFSTNPADRFEQQKLTKRRIELAKQATPERYA